MNKWYVINTKPNSELIAVQKLKRHNYNVYCPTYISIVKHARKMRKIIKPLFPGYLFICLDISSTVKSLKNGILKVTLKNGMLKVTLKIGIFGLLKIRAGM